MRARVRLGRRVALHKCLFFGQHDEHPIRADRSTDCFGEAIKQILKRRDRLQDPGGIPHSGLEIDPARSDEEAVGETLRNAAGRRHGKGDH
jgi:hypothetical protein